MGMLKYIIKAICKEQQMKPKSTGFKPFLKNKQTNKNLFFNFGHLGS